MQVLMARAQVDNDTYYASYWISQLKGDLEELGYSVVDLADNLDTAANLEQEASTGVYDKLIVCGHGSAFPPKIEGYEKEPVLTAQNAYLAQNMDCFLVACSSARLGSELKRAGAKSVLSFTEPLNWESSRTSPFSDVLDDSVGNFVRVIGKTMVEYGGPEAYVAGYDYATEEAKRLAEQGGEKNWELSGVLIHDRDCLALTSDLGDIVPVNKVGLVGFVFAGVASLLALLGWAKKK